MARERTSHEPHPGPRRASAPALHSLGERSRRLSDTLRMAGVLACFVGGYALWPRIFPPRVPPTVGHPAPDFRLDIVANAPPAQPGHSDDGSLALSSLRGHVVILDFWATWCPPCRAEAPILDRVAHRWRDRGVIVVGVDTDTPDQGDPHDFAVAHGLSYPIVRDWTGATTRSYDVDVLPTLVVLSKEGTVVAARSGMTEDDEIERLIHQALDGSGKK